MAARRVRERRQAVPFVFDERASERASDLFGRVRDAPAGQDIGCTTRRKLWLFYCLTRVLRPGRDARR